MKRRLSVMAVVAVIGAAGIADAEQTTGTLTADDYIEIQQLYATYARALDLGDADAWADTFTRDGTFSTATGRDALVAYATGSYGRSGGTRRHWNSQLIITPTPEGANGSVYLLLVNTGVRPLDIVLAGIYQDTLVKTPAGWRFKQRSVDVDRPAESGQ